jgi:hypothetical protein
MAKLNIDVNVDENGIAKRVEEAIEDGVENAAEDISEQSTHVAKTEIVEEGAVWRGDLLASFEDDVKKQGDDVILKIQNISEHAEPVENGAEYSNKKPPIQELLPWVRDKLNHMRFDDPEWVMSIASYFRNRGDFSGWGDSEIARAYWLQQKIYQEGLDPVKFMEAAEEWVRRHGDQVVKNNIEKELRKYGFI